MGGRNQRFTQALSGFLRERDSPFFRIDGIYFLDHNTASEITTEMSERFKEFGISSRIRRIVPGTSHGNEQFLAAVYRLLDSAITHGFSRVLVISSLELLPYDLEGVLSNILGELENKAWSICFLGLDDDPSTGSPLESAKSGLLWIHHDGSNSLAGSMISSGSFLINLESDANWMRAWSKFSDDPKADFKPKIAETTRETQDDTACYAVFPPATVRRDHFDTVGDPARYCSTREHSGGS